MPPKSRPLEELVARAGQAAEGLKSLAHHTRLLAICFLEEGEKTVGELEKLLGTSQSNISQHLAVMKRQGMVQSRRHANQVFYRIANRKVIKLVGALRDLYC